ncbi:hypothetical protein B0H21DRAFT_421702 [Amylocystis lapponica]|nr:hypothetical protein B0H21DRAFT_421702 [Amylocystis lapponica]
MREIAFDRLVNIFLTGILSAHAKHCIFLSHRDDNQSSEATNLPLSVIISDSAPTKLLECLAAPTRMSQMLYRTLIFFIMHHYRSLSDVDASVMMDARLSAYSIFHCQTEFTIFSNVPRLDKAPDGRYQWSFETKESMSYRWTMPLKHVSRIVMLDAMLALEQHLYELKGFLKFT